MVGRTFFPATVTAVFVVLVQYIVSDAVQYATTNGNVVLDPKIPPGSPLTGILWKHNNDKAVEWESPSDLTGYREFKDTTRLNTTTGELTIRRITSRFSGEYVAECTINTMTSQHVFTQSVEVIDPVSQLKVGCEKNGTIVKVNCSATGPMIEYQLSGPGREGAPWSKQPIVAPFDATTESVSYTCSAKNPVSKKSRVFISNDCNSPGGDESLNAVAIVVPVLVVCVLIAAGCVIYWCICKKRGYCGNSGDIESGKKGKILKDNNDVSLNKHLLQLNPALRNTSRDESDERGAIQKASTPAKDPSTNRFVLQSPSKASLNNDVSSNEQPQHLTRVQRNSVLKRAALIDQGIYMTEEEMANKMEKEETNGLELDDQSNRSTEKVDSLIYETIITTGEVPKDKTLLEIEEEGVNSPLLHQDPATQPPLKPPRCPEIRSSDAIGQNPHDRLPAQEDCGKHDENQEVEETTQNGSEQAKEENEASRKVRGQSEGEDEKEREGMMRENVESKKEEEREAEKVKVEGRQGDQDEAADEEGETEGGEREEGEGTEREDQAQAEDEDRETNRSDDDDDDDDDDGENVESEGTMREMGEAGEEERSEAGGYDGKDGGGGEEGSGSEKL